MVRENHERLAPEAERQLGSGGRRVLRENDVSGMTGMGAAAGIKSGGETVSFPKFSMADAAVIIIMVSGALPWFSPNLSASIGVVESPRPASAFLSDRKVDIKPRKPKSGIGTGLVIAYGHPIAPPYLVEYRGDYLFVNDVQVKPSIIDERKWAAKSARPRDERYEHVMGVMERTLARAQDMARKGSTQQKVIEFLRAQDFVEKVISEGQQAVVVSYFGGKTVVVELPAEGTSVLTPSQIAERSSAAKSNDVSGINGALARGNCVIFVNGGTSEERITSRFPAIVPQTMNDPELSPEEKLRRLNVVLVESAAKDIVANYDEREWSWRGSR